MKNDRDAEESTNKSELVRVTFTADLDRDNLNRYLTANFDTERVEITDRETGNTLATVGQEPAPFVCPACKEEAVGIVTAGKTKTYYHAGKTDCEVDNE